MMFTFLPLQISSLNSGIFEEIPELWVVSLKKVCRILHMIRYCQIITRISNYLILKIFKQPRTDHEGITFSLVWGKVIVKHTSCVFDIFPRTSSIAQFLRRCAVIPIVINICMRG